MTTPASAPTSIVPDAAQTRIYAAYSRPLWQRALFTREFAVITLLIAVFVYSTGNVDNFDSPLTLYYLFLDVAPILLISLPMTMIIITCLLYTSPSPRDGLLSRMPSSA